VGFQALYSNITGEGNVANGYQALYANTGDLNTATGRLALASNTIGIQNTADGASALRFNTTGNSNTAFGRIALYSNTDGRRNTASGQEALYSNITGNDNVANGLDALYSNTTGNGNVANGRDALYNNDGNLNIALGFGAGDNLTTGDDNIDIGNEGVADESSTIRIGTSGTQTGTYIAGISGATASGGAAVFVNTDGKLGTLTSSARFKTEIKPMDKASEAILDLKPVTFRYKHEIDPKGIPQFGLVAEEVAKVNPDLILKDKEGKPLTVRYEQINAMLLNEFLKEHHKVEQMQKQIDALTAVVQKVSAQLEVSKAAPQTVLNGQ
jgi:hypothetical protein